MAARKPCPSRSAGRERVPLAPLSFQVLPALLVLFASFSNATVISTPTITTSTYWSLANSPYTITTSLTVTANLTIEAGVVVISQSASTSAPAITISGAAGEIYSMGTLANPVVFNFDSVPASAVGLSISGITRRPSYTATPGAPSSQSYILGSGSILQHTKFTGGNISLSISNAAVHLTSLSFSNWGFNALAVTFPSTGAPAMAVENISIDPPRASATSVDTFAARIDANNLVAKLNLYNVTIRAGGLRVENFAATSAVSVSTGSITGHRASDLRMASRVCFYAKGDDINYSFSFKSFAINCEDTAAYLALAHRQVALTVSDISVAAASGSAFRLTTNRASSSDWGSYSATFSNITVGAVSSFASDTSQNKGAFYLDKRESNTRFNLTSITIGSTVGSGVFLGGGSAAANANQFTLTSVVIRNCQGEAVALDTTGTTSVVSLTSLDVAASQSVRLFSASGSTVAGGSVLLSQVSIASTTGNTPGLVIAGAATLVAANTVFISGIQGSCIQIVGANNTNPSPAYTFNQLALSSCSGVGVAFTNSILARGLTLTFASFSFADMAAGLSIQELDGQLNLVNGTMANIATVFLNVAADLGRSVAANYTLQNVRLSGTLGQPLGSPASPAVYFHTANQSGGLIAITDCTFSSFSGSALKLANVPTVTIASSTFTNTGQSLAFDASTNAVGMIDVKSSGALSVSSCTFNSTSNSAPSIYLSGCASILIDSNTFTSGASALYVDSYLSTMRVTNNMFRSFFPFGIRSSFATSSPATDAPQPAFPPSSTAISGVVHLRGTSTANELFQYNYFDSCDSWRHITFLVNELANVTLNYWGTSKQFWDLPSGVSGPNNGRSVNFFPYLTAPAANAPVDLKNTTSFSSYIINAGNTVQPTPGVYSIAASIEINNGGTLILGPNVVFLMGDGVAINVRSGGRLIVNGTSRYIDAGFAGHDASLSSVAVIRNDFGVGQWAGINFYSGAVGSTLDPSTQSYLGGSLLRNCIILNGGKGSGALVQLNNTSLYVEGCLFQMSSVAPTGALVKIVNQKSLALFTTSAFINTGISLVNSGSSGLSGPVQAVSLVNCQGSDFSGKTQSTASLLAVFASDMFPSLVSLTRCYCSAANCIVFSGFGSSSAATIADCLFHGTNPVSMRGSDSSSLSTTFVVSNSRFESTVGNAIFVKNAHLSVQGTAFVRTTSGQSISVDSNVIDSNGNVYNVVVTSCRFDNVANGIRLSNRFLGYIQGNTFVGGFNSSILVQLQGGSQSLLTAVTRNTFTDVKCDVCVSVGKTAAGANNNERFVLWRNNFVRASANNVVHLTRISYAFGSILGNVFLNNSLANPSAGVVLLYDSAVQVKGNMFNDRNAIEISITNSTETYDKCEISENYWFERNYTSLVTGLDLTFSPVSSVAFANATPTTLVSIPAHISNDETFTVTVSNMPSGEPCNLLLMTSSDLGKVDFFSRYSTLSCKFVNSSALGCGVVPKNVLSGMLSDAALVCKTQFVVPLDPFVQDAASVSLTTRYHRIPSVVSVSPDVFLINQDIFVSVQGEGLSNEPEGISCRVRSQDSGTVYEVSGTYNSSSLVFCNLTRLELSIGTYDISINNYGNSSEFAIYYSSTNGVLKVSSMVSNITFLNDLTDAALYTISARASPTSTLPVISATFQLALRDNSSRIVDVSDVEVTASISPFPVTGAVRGTTAKTVNGVASFAGLGFYAQYNTNYSITFSTQVNGHLNVTISGITVPSCGTNAVPLAPDYLTCVCKEGTTGDSSSCTPCAKGTFKNSNGSSLCTPCPSSYTTEDTGSTSVSMCLCSEGSYRRIQGTNVTCSSCPNGAYCAGGSSPPLSLDGYYPKNATSSSVDGVMAYPDMLFYKCSTGSYCAANNMCEEGSEGFLCSKCTTGYYRNNYECQKCTDISNAGGVIAIIVLAAVLVAMAALLMGLFLPAGAFKFAALGIALNTIQIISLYQYLDIVWPDFLTNTYIRFSFFNFNIGLTAPECSFAVLRNTLLKWKLTLFIPPAIAVFIAVCVVALAFILAALRKLKLVAALQEDRYKFTKRQYFNAWKRVFVQFLVLTYTNMFSTTLNMVNCLSLEDGSSVLFAEKSVLCDSADADALRPFIGFGVVAYVLGIPVLLVLFLVRNRHQLDRPSVILSYGFLYDDYRLFYWEVVIMIRTFILVLLLVMLKQYIQIQVFAITIILTLFILLNMAVKPFHMRTHNRLEVLALTTMLVLLSAAFFYHEYSDTSEIGITPNTKVAMEALVGLFLFIVIFIFCLNIIWEVIGVLPQKVRKAFREPILRALLPFRRLFKNTTASLEDKGATPESMRPTDRHYDPARDPSYYLNDDLQMPDFQLAAAKEYGMVGHGNMLPIATSTAASSSTAQFLAPPSDEIVSVIRSGSMSSSKSKSSNPSPKSTVKQAPVPGGSVVASSKLAQEDLSEDEVRYYQSIGALDSVGRPVPSVTLSASLTTRNIQGGTEWIPMDVRNSASLPSDEERATSIYI